jgi:hypothetical protein
MRILIFFLLFSTFALSQGGRSVWSTKLKDSVTTAINNAIDTVKYFEVIIDNDAISSSSFSQFTVNPTFALSGDTLICSSTAEFDSAGRTSSTDNDYTITVSTASEIRFLFGELTNKKYSAFWEYGVTSGIATQIGNTYNFDTTTISNRIDLKLDITDTTNFRTFSDSKYVGTGASADTTAFRTFSDLKYLKNADSTAVRTFSDLKYGLITDTTDVRTLSMQRKCNIILKQVCTKYSTQRFTIQYLLTDTQQLL